MTNIPSKKTQATPEITDSNWNWQGEIEVTKEEKYRNFLRALRRTRGFSFLFVECSSPQAEWLIENSKKDLPHKKIAVYKLDKAIKTFYNSVAEEVKKQNIDILFVQGLEHSLYEYEAQRKEEDWASEDIYNYSWKNVPPILSHLNQQRERFRDDFNICFVFVLPSFGINYFIQRAPDFFDWRSNLFRFPLDKDSLQQEYSKLAFGDIADYQSWTHGQRRNRLVEIQGILDEEEQTQAQKATLYFEQGLLNQIDNYPELAIASYNQAVAIKPDLHEAWYNRGVALGKLGRYEEAIASYDQAVAINPDLHEAWYNRGNALGKLGRNEEAIASYDQAVAIKPDKHEAWFYRGNALVKLGRNEEAIASFDQAVAIKPDDHQAWYNRGFALVKLGRNEEAIASYDQALEINPDYAGSYYNLACGYALQENIELAIENLRHAINLDIQYQEMAKTDSDFDKIRDNEQFKNFWSEIE